MYSSDEENNRNFYTNSDKEKSEKNSNDDDYILDIKEVLKKDKKNNIKIVKSNSTTLNNLFRDSLINQENMKDSKFNFSSNSFINKTYNNYIDFINKYISDKEKKMTKIIEEKKKKDNFISYVDNNIFKQIESIFEIQENIFDAISDNIQILIDFLNEFNLIFERNPLEKFINLKGKKIFDSFLFNKINYKKINLTNLTLYSNFNQNFKK